MTMILAKNWEIQVIQIVEQEKSARVHSVWKLIVMTTGSVVIGVNVKMEHRQEPAQIQNASWMIRQKLVIVHRVQKIGNASGQFAKKESKIVLLMIVLI